jgi:hypothetical protein
LFSVLTLPFDEPKRAQQVKEALVKVIRQGGDLILDEMVMRVTETNDRPKGVNLMT